MTQPLVRGVDAEWALAQVLRDALQPSGFTYVGNTHGSNKWFSLGSAFSRDNIIVFFNASTGWISLKDYNNGVESDLDERILTAIKSQVRKSYHQQLQFRFQHDCLG